MSQRYPEVLRVNADRTRILHGRRHNHCFTSPVYREKTRIINRKLAERYKDHPALVMWHVSNEISGECHCELCQAAFREWLKARYGTLEALNFAWWTRFWSKVYTDWEQIVSPCPHGESGLHGLNIDWRRFTTDQIVDYLQSEFAPLREVTPGVPITTNLMGFGPFGMDNRKVARICDVVSWDSYPKWHESDDALATAESIAFCHDMMRSFGHGRPWLLMESTPSATNWMEFAKLKRPGMHKLSSLLAVAHGSDSVQYFQWRKSRGGPEKFHGAVVDHVGHENTRVFRDVADLGATLSKLGEVVGSRVQADAAVVFDWENRWAISDANVAVRDAKDYEATCVHHYRPLWQAGAGVDVIGADDELTGYKLVIAPMLYMVTAEQAARIERFVRGGGVFVTTYFTGWVDERDLCHLGGFPGPLRGLLGIWAEEIDALYPGQTNRLSMREGNELGVHGSYGAHTLCELIHAESAEVVGECAEDFYAGRPALTVNRVGSGEAWYIAARTEQRFLEQFYGSLIQRLDLARPITGELPDGVIARSRQAGSREFVFVMNVNDAPAVVDLDDACGGIDMETGEPVECPLELEAYEVRVIRR
jgi:beta-galactosidase